MLYNIIQSENESSFTKKTVSANSPKEAAENSGILEGLVNVYPTLANKEEPTENDYAAFLMKDGKVKRKFEKTTI